MFHTTGSFLTFDNTDQISAEICDINLTLYAQLYF